MTTETPDVDHEFNKEAFHFLKGFFIVPFLFFIIKTTISLMKNTQISEGVAILYLSLLVGIYYILRGKDGYPKFRKGFNPWNHQVATLCGLVMFLFAYFKFDNLLSYITSL